MREQYDGYQIANKTIVVTGAAGQIAQEYCSLVAGFGARCILLDLEGEHLVHLASRLPMPDVGPHLVYQIDLRSAAEINAFVEWVGSKVSAIDVLVNNAAFTGDTQLKGWGTDFAAQSVEAWNAAISVNLTACFLLSQKLTPLLRESESSCILNIGSIYGALGPDMSLYEGTAMGNPAAYAASKGGLIQLTRWLSTVLAPNVRVNCISAGGVARGQDAKFVERYQRKVPLDRMATENDIAKAMLFLTSDLASYVSGQNLMVDGGFSSW
jgi:NAD(P)-dependent dehydrogenase (short-subunit alcohol dehydrogenase family)